MDSLARLWYDRANMLEGLRQRRFKRRIIYKLTAGRQPPRKGWEEQELLRPFGRIYMAGRRNRYGYQEYRGRSGGRIVLIFIIVLLAVLLVAGMAIMYFMGEYIRYTDTGVEIELPWLNSEPSAPPEFSDPVVIVSDNNDVVVTEEPDPTPSPTPLPQPQYDTIGVITVSEGQVRSGTAAQAVAASGGNALAVEMKATSGELNWVSQSPLAISLGVNGWDDVTGSGVRALAADTDLYLIARLHCFKDSALANARIGAIMTQGGNIWYDRVGTNWSSPANQQAADYISALCLELADLGFDEIVLEDAGFPDDGQTSVLAVSENRPEDLTAPVSALLERLHNELAEKGVCLSVQVTEAALRGDNALSGITPEALAKYAGRVWLPFPTLGTDYTAVFTAAGWSAEEIPARVVVENGYSGSWYR